VSRSRIRRSARQLFDDDVDDNEPCRRCRSDYDDDDDDDEVDADKVEKQRHAVQVRCLYMTRLLIVRCLFPA